MAPSTKPILAGRVLTLLAVLFLAFDGIAKVAEVEPVVRETVRLGYPAAGVRGIGIVLLLCTLLYAIPRTALPGAILLTGYLGGAAATHARLGASAFPIAFAVGFGALVWAGLCLRDGRLRAILTKQENFR